MPYLVDELSAAAYMLAQFLGDPDAKRERISRESANPAPTTMHSSTLANDLSSSLALAFATFQPLLSRCSSMPPLQILCSQTLADSFSLFALFSTLPSLVFNSLRTLCAKRRGVGGTLRHLRALRACPFFRRASALSFAVILWLLLFSSTYKSPLVAHRFATFSVFIHLQFPFSATSLYSHLYKTPGCHPTPQLFHRRSGPSSPEIFLFLNRVLSCSPARGIC